MDFEKTIVTLCAESPESAYAQVIDSGVTAEMFAGDYSALWAYAIEYIKQHGRGPSATAIFSRFEWFEPDLSISEPMSFYIAELKRKHAYNLTLQAIQGAYTDLSARNIEDAVSKMRDALRRIEDSASNESDLDWNANAHTRYQEYLTMRSGDGIDGYRTPFKTLDEATQGFHNGEFVLIAARQGVGKTWLSNIMAHENLKEGLRVLYFTKEMPSRQVARRFDALAFSLPYPDLRRGSLETHVQMSWEKNSLQLPLGGSLIIAGEESGGVSQVAAKIERHKPHIVYIDGMYLMEDDQRAKESWQRIGNISRDLKRLAKRVNLPIIATVQLNRSADNTKGDAANIAMGDIAKDADVILGLFQDEDQRVAKRMTLRVLKQREGDRPEIECDWDMSEMRFGEIGDIDVGPIKW